MSKVFSFLSVIFCGVSGLYAQTFIVGTAIPDGDATGLMNRQTISSSPGVTIADLNVTLSISGTELGGFSGDLYATLQHQSGFSVLLNRSGKRNGASQGYSDSGLNVTFDDQAAANVHNYRFALSTSHSTPLAGPLSGPWSPDGRTTDPASVLDGNTPGALLNSFQGLPVNGEWVLFVSDLSSGGTHRLDSWGMEITPVPEPTRAALACGVALAAFAFWHKRRNSRQSIIG